MDYNDDHNTMDWEANKEYSLEENFNTDMNTPAKSFGDLSYHNKGKESANYYSEPSSQLKRRRMLQFEEQTLKANTFSDEMFLRSEETSESLEDAFDDMSNWDVGFEDDDTLALDPSAEGWISECFVEPELQMTSEDCANGAADVQLETTGKQVCEETHAQRIVETPATKLPVRSLRGALLRGTKSYIRTPPKKTASSVAYPFTFIKPCAARGDTTLSDINKRILTPPKPKADEKEMHGKVQTSAFSGKPVVGKTKIRTEGGEGSITILRTKG